jgi:tRNA-dihydrouridine synthase B
MKIGPLKIENSALLAPMAGFTDMPFRILCKEQGAGIVYTEFVSSEGLIRGSERTGEYLVFHDRERPLGIQLFGHNPESMAIAASLLAEHYHPDLIDINYGCSVRKVVKKGAGAALLKDIELAARIARAIVSAVAIPVTAKIRSGWTQESKIAVDLALRLETAGIQALTVHPRTASMTYRHQADWGIIGSVKDNLKIPVIGNGDIKTADDALEMFRETHCDAVMVGRGALGNPWIFAEIRAALLGQPVEEISTRERVAMCLRHLQMEAEFRDPIQANRIMKKNYRWYFRSIPRAAEIRQTLIQATNIQSTICILEALQDEFRDKNQFPNDRLIS